MMNLKSIGQRIKEIRTSLPGSVSQKAFAESMGMTRSQLNSYERDDVTPSDAVIKLICMTYNINWLWLKSGEGEMLEKSDSSLVAQLAKEYGLDGAAQTLLSTFLGLESGSRDVIIRFMKDFANRLSSSGAPGSSADETGALYFNQWTEPHKQRAQDDNGLDFRENNI